MRNIGNTKEQILSMKKEIEMGGTCVVIGMENPSKYLEMLQEAGCECVAEEYSHYFWVDEVKRQGFIFKLKE